MKFTSAITVLLAAACSSLPFASASKDDSYYPNGVTNPNVNDKMYWKEPYNVLEDIDQFDALYVTFHSCTWANYDGEGDGGGGGGWDTWYLGGVPSWRANAAYSLYGILKGGKDKGCSKQSYINSFHTTQGIDTFTNAVAAAGLTNLFTYVSDDNIDDAINDQYMTSTCFQSDGEGGGDNNNDDVSNGQKYDSNTKSYGLGCTSDHTFAIFTYGGQYCDANDILETQDTLQDFNSRIDKAKCVPIFKKGDSYNQQQDGQDDDSSSPLALLQTSTACELYDGTGACPDPYGKLKTYESALSQATGAVPTQRWWSPRRVSAAGSTMISAGLLLAIAGLVIILQECRKPSKKSKGDKQNLPSLFKKVSRSFGNGTGKIRSSKASRSPKNKTSKKRKESMDSPKSTKSGRSTRSEPSNLAEKEIHVVSSSTSNSPSKKSARGNLNDPRRHDQGQVDSMYSRNRLQDDTDAFATQSVQAVTTMIDFVKKRSTEFFQDEHNDDDDPVVTKIPDVLPQSSPRKASSDQQTGGSSDANSSAKRHKRRWFQKLLGESEANDQN